MSEFVNVRASEVLDQGELVRYLKSQFPTITKKVGQSPIPGTECVEVRVPSDSPEFDAIQRFIDEKRKQGIHGFTDFSIGRYLRRYTKAELRVAEILLLKISSHFEPCGEECGTIYKTLCHHCNFARQESDLILDLRRAPQHKDISESIAWIEWIVSSKFVKVLTENGLTGAEFLPVFDLRNPMQPVSQWHQLRITSSAGQLAAITKLGRDPFSSSGPSWHCPLGHSVVTEFLSEIYLHRDSWQGCDIAVTKALFGQGRNLLRPTPLIMVSQRMYRILEEAGLTGFSYEIAHLV